MRFLSSAALVAVLATAIAVPNHRLNAQGQQPPTTAGFAGQADALRKSTDNLYNKQLTALEMEVRDDVTLVRDSVDVAAGLSERLTRAAGTNTQSVMISAAKSLQPACAAAARMVDRVRPHFVSLHLTAKDSTLRRQADKVLVAYRGALVSLGGLMTTCDKDVAASLHASKPDVARLTRTADDVKTGVLSYEAHLRAMLNQFDIPFRPKEQAVGG